MSFMEGPGHAAFCGNDGPHEKHRHPLPDSYEVCSGVSARRDPVTDPDMVSIIEKVLAAHQPFSSHWDHPREMVNTASCDCGNLSSGAEQPDALHAAHQARAVLAALTKAGGVEWGVRVSDGSVEEHDTLTSAEDTCLDYPSTEAVVSRLTLPCQEVEP